MRIFLKRAVVKMIGGNSRRTMHNILVWKLIVALRGIRVRRMGSALRGSLGAMLASKAELLLTICSSRAAMWAPEDRGNCREFRRQQQKRWGRWKDQHVRKDYLCIACLSAALKCPANINALGEDLLSTGCFKAGNIRDGFKNLYTCKAYITWQVTMCQQSHRNSTCALLAQKLICRKLPWNRLELSCICCVLRGGAQIRAELSSAGVTCSRGQVLRKKEK